MERLKRFVENHWVNLIAGVVLLATAIIEVLKSTEEDGLGLGHGMVIFAALQVLKSRPHLLEAAETVSKARG